MKKSVVVLLAMLSLMFSSTAAFATGYGVFLDYSSGSGEYEFDDSSRDYDIDDSDVIAGGFVLDTAPTSESYFNYRLNVGVAEQSVEYQDEADSDAAGVCVENIFGFALIKEDNFRWWLGPLVRIGYYSGDIEYISHYGDEEDADFDYAEFGVGAVTGMNFKSGNVVISPSVGVRYSGYAGEAEYDNGYDEDIEATTTTVFANIALLF